MFFEHLKPDTSVTEAIRSICVEIDLRRTFSLSGVQSFDNNSNSLIPLCFEAVDTSKNLLFRLEVTWILKCKFQKHLL